MVNGLQCRILALDDVHMIESTSANLRQHLGATPPTKAVSVCVAHLATVLVSSCRGNNHKGICNGGVHRERRDSHDLHRSVLLRNRHEVAPYVHLVQGSLAPNSGPSAPSDDLPQRLRHGIVVDVIWVGDAPPQPLVGEENNQVLLLEGLNLLKRVQVHQLPLVAQILVSCQGGQLHEVPRAAQDHGMAQRPRVLLSRADGALVLRLANPHEAALLAVGYEDPSHNNGHKDESNSGGERDDQGHDPRVIASPLLLQGLQVHRATVTVDLVAPSPVGLGDGIPPPAEVDRELLLTEGSAVGAGPGPQLQVWVVAPAIATVVARLKELPAFAVVLGGAVRPDIQQVLPKQHFHSQLVLLLAGNTQWKHRVRRRPCPEEGPPQILVLLLGPFLRIEFTRLGGEVGSAERVKVRVPERLGHHGGALEVGHDHKVPQQVTVLLERLGPEGNRTVLEGGVVVGGAVDPHAVPLVLLGVKVGAVHLALLRIELGGAGLHRLRGAVVHLLGAEGAHTAGFPVRPVLVCRLPDHGAVFPLGLALGLLYAGLGVALALANGALGEDPRDGSRQPHVGRALPVVPVVLVQLGPTPRPVVNGVHPEPPCQLGRLKKCWGFKERHGLGVLCVEPYARVGPQILQLG
mmetsp:Transcript_58473/g.174157  ORF Transcript_58473/g.174157 Transcript_58473/m.174157 type:complete len:633 (-) Transcript_58473:1203-3101(-)